MGGWNQTRARSSRTEGWVQRGGEGEKGPKRRGGVKDGAGPGGKAGCRQGKMGGRGQMRAGPQRKGGRFRGAGLAGREEPKWKGWGYRKCGPGEGAKRRAGPEGQWKGGTIQ